jgi:hypothetical protein
VGALIVCRFLLDIREFNAHLNGASNADHSPHLSKFQAAVRSAGNAIVEEFGDPLFNQPLSTQPEASATPSGGEITHHSQGQPSAAGSYRGNFSVGIAMEGDVEKGHATTQTRYS